MAKDVEAGKLAVQNVARLQKELDEANTKVRKEKATFANVVNAKNKQIDELEKAARAATNAQLKNRQEYMQEVARQKEEIAKHKEEASKHKGELAKRKEEASKFKEEASKLKAEVARHMQENLNVGRTLEERQERLGKVTADFQKLQSDSQNRITDNVKLRAQIRDHLQSLEERDRTHRALTQEIKTLKAEHEERKAYSEKLEKELAAKAAQLRRLALESAMWPADKLKLEQQIIAKSAEQANLEQQLAANAIQEAELAEQIQIEQYQLDQEKWLRLDEQIKAQTASNQSLAKQLDKPTADYRKLEQQKMRLEVDLAAKSKPVPPSLLRVSDPNIQREMRARDERILAEEAQKHAAEIARLRTENAALLGKASKRKGDSKRKSDSKWKGDSKRESGSKRKSDSERQSEAAPGIPLSPVSSRSSLKRPLDEPDAITDAEKKAFAEEVVHTLFDVNGICIGCR